jgi:Histidine phosphatase superfamily (branch 1)
MQDYRCSGPLSTKRAHVVIMFVKQGRSAGDARAGKKQGATEAFLMPTRLTLICDGATAATRVAAFPLDEPLEDRALSRAAVLGQALRRADRALTSPALRARQTAAALSLDAAVTPSARLRPRALGRAQAWGEQLCHVALGLRGSSYAMMRIRTNLEDHLPRESHHSVSLSNISHASYNIDRFTIWAFDLTSSANASAPTCVGNSASCVIVRKSRQFKIETGFAEQLQDA